MIFCLHVDLNNQIGNGSNVNDLEDEFWESFLKQYLIEPTRDAGYFRSGIG